MRYEVSLTQTLDVSDHPEKIEPLASGPHVKNTGIERDGGLTNIAADFTAAAFVAGDLGRGVSKSGKVVRVDANGVITVDGRPVYSNSSPPQVFPRHAKIAGDDDYCLDTVDLLPIGVRAGRNNVTVTKYNTDGSINASRQIAIAGVSEYTTTATIIRSQNVTYLGLNQLILSSATGILAYNAGPVLVVPGTLTPPIKKPLYAYKYEAANQYILWNCETELAIVGDIMGGAVGAAFPVKRLMEDVAFGFSRHIITVQPTLVGANINAVALIGHTTLAAAFSAVPVWQYPAGMNASAVAATYRCAQGYVEAFYTDTVSGNPYWFAGYRFDELLSPVTPQVPFCVVPVDHRAGFRQGYAYNYIEIIDGVGSFLSGFGQSVVVANETHAACALTPVGTLDDTFVIPNLTITPGGGVNPRSALLARDVDGAMDYINMEALLVAVSENLLEQIGPERFKVKWLDPMNIIDCEYGEILLSALAYHNAIQPMYSVAPSATLVSLTSRVELPEFISIDTGEKQYGDNYGWVNCWGMRPGMVARVYSQTSYFASYNGIDIAAPFGLSPLIEQDLVGTLYVPSELLPYPIPISRNTVGAWRGGFSCVLTEGFNEYTIGNEYTLEYIFFSLFGQRYALSNGIIYLITLGQDGFVVDVAEIAKADGLRLFAVAPTVVYFYSSWDNAIYTFDGGQSVSKLARLTQESILMQGAFSSHENMLILDSGPKFLTQRDGIVSEIPKTADQVTLSQFFPTDEGMAVVDAGGVTYYRFYGGTPMPLEWQSAYFGQQANQRGILSAVVFTVYSPTKDALDVTIGVDQFDETDDYTQRETIHVTSQDYSAQGYFRMRLQPQVQRALGSSIYFACPQKVLLASVAITYEDETQSVIPEGASV